MLCTLIDLLSYAIHKHSIRSQSISVLTKCTFMLRQLCIIEPSFFNATSGRPRRPIEGRHIVIYNILNVKLKILEPTDKNKVCRFVVYIKNEYWVYFVNLIEVNWDFLFLRSIRLLLPHVQTIYYMSFFCSIWSPSFI